MSGEQQLWAARDENGFLFLYEKEPQFFEGIDGGEFGRGGDAISIDDSNFPSLKPGEKCRVRIVPLMDRVVHAVKTLLSYELGDGISQESVCMGQELARHIVQTRS